MKKNIVYSVLLCALATTASANIVSNKTFMRARDTLSNNALLMRTGHLRGHWKSKQNRIGSTISVAGYYRSSHNEMALATAFGGGQEVNNTQDGIIRIEAGQGSSMADRAYNLYSNAMDHIGHAGTTAGGMYGTVTLNPSRTEAGAHISYKQDLEFIAPGLALHVEAPVISVMHDLGATFAGTAHSESTYGESGTSLKNYFNGRSLLKAANSKQQGLKYARIDGASHSASGIADIHIGLSKRWFTNSMFRAHSSVYATIPTIGQNTGEHLFEPQLGSHHCGAGIKGTIMTSLWRNHEEQAALRLSATLDYRYLFRAEEVRTLGIYNHWYNVVATSSQYRNIGLAGATETQPAANALTRLVSVKPGQLFDLIMSARYRFKEYSVGIHYNMHARDAESVKLLPSTRWFDGEYGMMPDSCAVNTDGGIIVGSNNFTVGGALQQEGNTTTITKDSAGANVGDNNAAQYYITTSPCSAPTAITHKLAASGEWSCRSFHFPFAISIGAEYELNGFRKSNNSILSWAVWSKASVCF